VHSLYNYEMFKLEHREAEKRAATERLVSQAIRARRRSTRARWSAALSRRKPGQNRHTVTAPTVRSTAR
jgi:hypothetical protein